MKRESGGKCRGKRAEFCQGYDTTCRCFVVFCRDVSGPESGHPTEPQTRDLIGRASLPSSGHLTELHPNVLR